MRLKDHYEFETLVGHKIRHCPQNLTSLWPLGTVVSVLMPLLLRGLIGSTLWLGLLMASSLSKLLQEHLGGRAHFLLPVLPPACRLSPVTLLHLENYMKQERSGAVLPNVL